MIGNKNSKKLCKKFCVLIKIFYLMDGGENMNYVLKIVLSIIAITIVYSNYKRKVREIFLQKNNRQENKAENEV